ncbi:MAG: hypothetical protein ETSY2_12785 [Candidatus Entotheonella gemina]|uniref:Uncharacterized protein n=1 Tax=Candidatus Entotheonella gemina TaxID=1429439 RepID=W4MAD7_9BACT|nr:MAG: hypothetical protein ETSY2_12785 [Candidatus Entotheonella gemina]
MATPRSHRCARDDVEKIWLNIEYSEHNIDAADPYVEQFEERSQTYAENPELGLAEPKVLSRLERALDIEFSPGISIRSFLTEITAVSTFPTMRIIDVRRDRERALEEE